MKEKQGRGDIIRNLLQKIGLMKKEDKAPPLFPELRKEKILPNISAQHVSHLIMPASLPSQKSIPDKTPVKEFVFPELSVAKQAPAAKEKEHVDQIINVIYDEVNRKESPRKEAGSRKEEGRERQLFFHKIERLMKETKLSEDEIRNFIDKDLVEKMKEFHEKERKGEPQLFDAADFQEHLAKKIEHLKNLENDWEKMGREIDELRSGLETREAEIAVRVKELKELLVRCNSFEKSALLQEVKPLSWTKDVSTQTPLQDQYSSSHASLENHPVRGNDLAEAILQAALPVSPVVHPSDASTRIIPVASPLIYPGINPNVPLMPSVPFADNSMETGASVVGSGEKRMIGKEVKDRTLAIESGFIFSNGAVVTSLQGLRQALPGLPMDVIRTHINNEVNHFVPWIFSFFDEELAKQAGECSSAEELQALFDSLTIV